MIETLSANRLGAVLIHDENESPVGVLSKTDLIAAYHHGISPYAQARKIMTTPVHSVSAEELLSTAI